MNLPAQIRTETELEDILARPSEADVEFARRLERRRADPRRRRQDGAVAGAARPPGDRAWRQPPSRHGGVAILVAGGARPTRGGRDPDAGVRPARPAQIAALPRAENVLFLAGRKFGTLDRTDLTWVTNTVVPARVAEHFAQSRMVVFSTGNVYPLVRSTARLDREAIRRRPVGEYAQSCLGRERVVEFVSHERAMPALMFRLNYAVDLRYGTLVDIARKVFTGEPIDLAHGLLQRHLAG